MLRIKRLLCFVVSLLIINLLFQASLVAAQDESDDAEEASEEGGEEGAVPQQAIYLPMKPAFVVNYGGAGRLRYIKTEVSVRVANIDAANALQYHMPFVRNNLVMLFASQTTESVSSQDGREKIRSDALEEVRNVLEKENQIPREDVVEVFFNSFIVQK